MRVTLSTRQKSSPRGNFNRDCGHRVGIVKNQQVAVFGRAMRRSEPRRSRLGCLNTFGQTLAIKRLLVGRHDVFRSQGVERLIGNRLVSVVARSTVLVSGEYGQEKFAPFAAEARNLGFSGLLLRIADEPASEIPCPPSYCFYL